MTVVAPDGGFWGWMAVIACFMGNLIGDGVMYRLDDYPIDCPSKQVLNAKVILNNNTVFK